jgi:hypothetical protein
MKSKSAVNSRTEIIPAIKTSTLWASLVAAVLGTVVSANAQLLSYESFSGYTVGLQLPAVTPAPNVAGYTGDWIGWDWFGQAPVVMAGPLTYNSSFYLNGSGNHVTLPFTPGDFDSSGRASRVLDSSLVVDGSTAGVRYLSFLYQNGLEQPSSVYQALELLNGQNAGGNNRALAVGSFGGGVDYHWIVGNESNDQTTGVTGDLAVHLFVVKFDLSATAASDIVTLWVDPTLGGVGEPVGGLTQVGLDIAFDRLGFGDYDGNSASWGEIRWGGSFDSVTPVPEPSAIALLGLSGLVLWCRQQSKI